MSFTIQRVVRPSFKVRASWPARVWDSKAQRHVRGTATEARSFFSERQGYLWLARCVIRSIREHYVDDDGSCRLCGTDIVTTCLSNGEFVDKPGCRYHDNESFRELAERIAAALRRRDRRRAELATEAHRRDPLVVRRRNAVAAICLSTEAIARNARELQRLADQEHE